MVLSVTFKLRRAKIDATVIDATVIDATVIDATVIEATVIDATVIDATAIDATVIDATAIDATVISVNLNVKSLPGCFKSNGFDSFPKGLSRLFCSLFLVLTVCAFIFLFINSFSFRVLRFSFIM